MGAAEPLFSFSIIIINCGRVAYVAELLRSLQAARSQFAGASEVILVDDSPVPEANAIAQLCAEYSARLETFGPSVGAKRNRGASLALNDVLLFLDSDCQATEPLLIEHERMYHLPGVAAMLGLLTFIGPDTWRWQAIERTPFVMPFQFPKFMDQAPWGVTANFSIRGDAFWSVGGFDESFPARPGGEDVDLGLRLTRNGLRIQCNPAAEVLHSKDTWVPTRAMRRRLYEWGIAEAYLMRRHPEKTVPAMPKRTVLAVANLFGFAVLSLVARDLRLLALWPIWMALDVVLQIKLRLVVDKGASPNFWQELWALHFVWIHELGLMAEVIRRGKWRYLFMQMLYTPGQLEGEWHYGSIRQWALFISLALTGGLALALVGLGS